MAASQTHAVFGEFDGIMLTREQFDSLQNEIVALDRRVKTHRQMAFWFGMCIGLICGSFLVAVIVSVGQALA